MVGLPGMLAILQKVFIIFGRRGFVPTAVAGMGDHAPTSLYGCPPLGCSRPKNFPEELAWRSKLTFRYVLKRSWITGKQKHLDVSFSE